MKQTKINSPMLFALRRIAKSCLKKKKKPQQKPRCCADVTAQQVRSRVNQVDINPSRCVARAALN